MALTLEDFRTPMFDRQKVVKRKVPARPTTVIDEDDEEDEMVDPFDLPADGGRKKRLEDAFEGTTFTDDYNEVGFTYYLSDGLLTVKDKTNRELFKGIISTQEDFEKALKKADKKVRKLRK